MGFALNIKEMDVKEIRRHGAIAWSKNEEHKDEIAAGTIAGTVDTSFDLTAKVELFSLDITSPAPEMKLVGSAKTEERLNKLVWGGCDLLIGSSKNILSVWNPNKIR